MASSRRWSWATPVCCSAERARKVASSTSRARMRSVSLCTPAPEAFSAFQLAAASARCDVDACDGADASSREECKAAGASAPKPAPEPSSGSITRRERAGAAATGTAATGRAGAAALGTCGDGRSRTLTGRAAGRAAGRVLGLALGLEPSAGDERASAPSAAVPASRPASRPSPWGCGGAIRAISTGAAELAPTGRSAKKM